MKSLTVGILVLAMITTVLAYAADTTHQKRCMDNTHKCGQTSDCCSGCCNRGVCDTLDRCNALNQGACAYHSCPPDKECYLHQVQCITAPCPPLPACRPKVHDDYDNYE